ncbi:MAG: hypothetical protein Ct9H90mP23_3220 [Methanobacteriota archaeon]|nr:MAG: hypothetical protein Ct9H90mP23_3220 [Euryarchaeota archaeon]
MFVPIRLQLSMPQHPLTQKEGGVEFIWDFDLWVRQKWGRDPTNDADSTSSSVEVMYADSGNQTGSLT